MCANSVAEYDFPHVCHLLAPKAGATEVARVYEKCAEQLGPNRAEASIVVLDLYLVAHGVHILLTERWLMLVKLTKPYTTWKGNAVYLHSLAYAGILTLPMIPLKWPQTADIDPVERNPLKILKSCSSSA